MPRNWKNTLYISQYHSLVLRNFSPGRHRYVLLFLVSQHVAQHLILKLAQNDCSINVYEGRLGLVSDLQVIKPKVGN